MIPEPIRLDKLPFELMVNGIPVRSVHVRCAPELADDFQVVIRDPKIGAFALHTGFELETRAEGSPWRPVTLEQLTKALTESREFLQAEDLPKASEMAERRLFDRLDEVDIPHRRSPRLGKITGHDRCVKRVQFLLYEAAIPHEVSGTVFLVPDATQARIALIRAGLEPSTISAGALIEPQSECAIHLLERPRSSGITRRAGSHGRTESSR